MNFDKPFWRTVFREADGTASSARLLTAVLVVGTLCLICVLTGLTHTLPDLAPVGMFLSTSTLSLYGVNKAGDAFKNIFSKIKGEATGTPPEDTSKDSPA